MTWSTQEVPMTRINRQRAAERRDELIAAGQYQLGHEESEELDRWLWEFSRAVESGTPIPEGDELEIDPGTEPGTDGPGDRPEGESK